MRNCCISYRKPPVKLAERLEALAREYGGHWAEITEGDRYHSWFEFPNTGYVDKDENAKFMKKLKKIMDDFDYEDAEIRERGE